MFTTARVNHVLAELKAVTTYFQALFCSLILFLAGFLGMGQNNSTTQVQTFGIASHSRSVPFPGPWTLIGQKCMHVCMSSYTGTLTSEWRAVQPPGTVFVLILTIESSSVTHSPTDAPKVASSLDLVYGSKRETEQMDRRGGPSELVACVQ